MTDDNKTENKEKKVSAKVKTLVEEIAGLSVLELSELNSSLQEKLGVTAAMPMAVAAQSAPVAEASAPQGEASGGNQTVVMTSAGANKIAVIKALREINSNLTLMDAKAMTETVPAEILKDAKPEDVKSASDKLKTAGATIELK